MNDLIINLVMIVLCWGMLYYTSYWLCLTVRGSKRIISDQGAFHLLPIYLLGVVFLAIWVFCSVIWAGMSIMGLFGFI